MSKPNNKRKPVELPAWTEEELDAMCQVTPEDVAMAQAWAKRNAPKRLAGELDAKPSDAGTQ